MLSVVLAQSVSRLTASVWVSFSVSQTHTHALIVREGEKKRDTVKVLGIEGQAKHCSP